MQSVGSSDARDLSKPLEVFAVWGILKGSGKAFTQLLMITFLLE